jgi:hypothetical protein
MLPPICRTDFALAGSTAGAAYSLQEGIDVHVIIGDSQTHTAQTKES